MCQRAGSVRTSHVAVGFLAGVLLVLFTVPLLDLQRHGPQDFGQANADDIVAFANIPGKHASAPQAHTETRVEPSSMHHNQQLSSNGSQAPFRADNNMDVLMSIRSNISPSPLAHTFEDNFADHKDVDATYANEASAAASRGVTAVCSLPHPSCVDRLERLKEDHHAIQWLTATDKVGVALPFFAWLGLTETRVV